MLSLASPYSKNKRILTIIDTDVPGATGVGLIAMIEVVALMIGDIASATAKKNTKIHGTSSPVCFSGVAVPKVYFARAAARRCCSFKKTAWNSRAISSAIYIDRTSKAVTRLASAVRSSKPM